MFGGVLAIPPQPPRREFRSIVDIEGSRICMKK
jgi:hypothetical protein